MLNDVPDIDNFYTVVIDNDLVPMEGLHQSNYKLVYIRPSVYKQGILS